MASMQEHPRPFTSTAGNRFRWWFREVGPFGPWSSEFSFNAGRTWHRYVWEAFDTAMKAGELQYADDDRESIHPGDYCYYRTPGTGGPG